MGPTTYTVEPLFSGHQWDPTTYTTYTVDPLFSGHQWDLPRILWTPSLVDTNGTYHVCILWTPSLVDTNGTYHVCILWTPTLVDTNGTYHVYHVYCGPPL